MVKITTDIRFDITPVEEWPEDKQADLTISLISYVDRELTIDVERALKFVDLAERNQLWRFVGKESLAELFERRDLTLEAIEQYRRGVQLLRDKGYAGTITEEQARKAVVTEAKANKDKQKRGPKPKGDNSTNFVEIGSTNKNENILRRLARDQPELLDKIETGELSVNAAAIAAGIRKKPTPAEIVVKTFAKVENRLETLRSIVRTLSDTERQVVKDWLSEQ